LNASISNPRVVDLIADDLAIGFGSELGDSEVLGSIPFTVRLTDEALLTTVIANSFISPRDSLLWVELPINPDRGLYLLSFVKH
jgi:hypothetical protein